MIKEEIVACAFQDKRNGKIYVSHTCHAEIIVMFFRAKDKETGHNCEQGFLTNLNRFVDRKEALKIAIAANQELHKWCDTDELYSEDIFWNPFEEKEKKQQEKLIDLLAENLEKFSKKAKEEWLEKLKQSIEEKEG